MNYNVKDIAIVLSDILVSSNISERYYKQNRSTLTSKINGRPGYAFSENDVRVYSEVLPDIVHILQDNFISTRDKFATLEGLRYDTMGHMDFLRTVIKLPYISGNYMNIRHEIFNNKTKLKSISNGTQFYFSDSEVAAFNHALKELARILGDITPVLSGGDDIQILKDVLSKSSRLAKSKLGVSDLKKWQRNSGIISVKDAAAITGLPLRTIYMKMHEGEIPSTKVNGMYKLYRKDVTAWAKRFMRK